MRPTTSPQFLLVEPVHKTCYPPIGLMKISTMLKNRYPKARVFDQVGSGIPTGLSMPKGIFITSLFTWDMDKVIKTTNYYQTRFPKATIQIGGIAASLLPDHINLHTGVKPHIGLLKDAENCPPDYTLTFGRKNQTSITFASRGCPRRCKFCSVANIEPKFYPKDDWEKDVSPILPAITFWDNNWLASPNLEKDCRKLSTLNKRVDFNQGLDARLYTETIASLLSKININPLRFAFDDIRQERLLLKAIRLAKKYGNKDIRVYVLYNFNDTPEDFYYRLNLLNREKVLSFPMEFRRPTELKVKFPGRNWNVALLRAMKLSLMYYYRKGMITISRESFLSIYGDNQKDFIKKLYDIYKYDKFLKRRKNETPSNILEVEKC